MSIIVAWQRVKKWVKDDKGWMLYSAFLLIIAIVILRDNRIKSEKLNKIVESENAKLTEIIQIKEQMVATLNSLQTTPRVLGETTTVIPTPTVAPSLGNGGILEIKAEIAAANIYESPTIGTTVLVTKSANEILFFKKVENGWYEIDLEENKSGWIQAELVNEIKP